MRSLYHQSQAWAGELYLFSRSSATLQLDIDAGSSRPFLRPSGFSSFRLWSTAASCSDGPWSSTTSLVEGIRVSLAFPLAAPSSSPSWIFRSLGRESHLLLTKPIGGGHRLKLSSELNQPSDPVIDPGDERHLCPWLDLYPYLLLSPKARAHSCSYQHAKQQHFQVSSDNRVLACFAT